MKTSRLAPIHPGEIQREEFMKPCGLSQNALARALNVPPRRINEIVLEKRGSRRHCSVSNAEASYESSRKVPHRRFENYSGLLCADLDNLECAAIEAAFANGKNDPHIVAAFKSPTVDRTSHQVIKELGGQ
jgi:hypothetical protein